MAVLRADQVEATLSRGHSTRVAVELTARFEPGDVVRAKNINPRGHTRLPRYARGRVGVVARDHGVFVFPDSSAADQGEQPQHLYSVRFAARELWGEGAGAGESVLIDLFADYLEPAGTDKGAA
jgi:nitrile hydratase beta subunit